MPTCGSCGQTTPPGAKFCPECGAPLPTTAERPHQARKTVTIVFSDLVGSTSLGEELDAESLRQVLDDYFTTMRAALESHGGVVEKFIGDAVMAVFGLPRMHEDDALRGVRAAVAMQQALALLNEDLAATRGVTLASRTGVNTGVVVVGDVAGAQRLATGDSVNVAARLEQAAPAGGIVLGPDTFRLVSGHVEASSIGSLTLKGKSGTIDAWRLDSLAPDNAVSRSATNRPLIGRLPELALIERSLDEATREGRIGSVVVVGEPGVGKSRLVWEIADRCAGTATVLRAACRPYGALSFSPLAELLGCLSESGGLVDRQLLQALLAAEAPGEDWEAIVERVASLLGLTETAFPLEETRWAASRLLAAVAPNLPLLLVIEDLHWAEEPLMDLLVHVQRQPRPAGGLILATARPELLEVSSLGDQGSPMQVVGLRALSPDESDALIDEVLGGPQLPRNARAVVHGAADGNPLFLEQALAAWIEQGVLSPAAQGWAVTRPVSEVRLPASVSAIISARLDRLPRDERRVLSAASVAGQTFDPAAVRSMLDEEDREACGRCLQRLLSSGLLIPVDRTHASADELTFEHASLREVAYEMSLKSDRARFHEHFAIWLENGDEDARSEGAIGHHLAEAYRYRTELRQVDTHTRELALRGARYLLSDSRRALSIGDRAGAERLTGRIVDLLTGCGPDVGSSDLLLMERAAKLLVTMGRWSVAVELLAPYASTDHGPLLRDLGVSLCQLHRSEPQSAEYREGQRLLEIAGAPPNHDTDAIASLAGTWKGLDDVRAQTYYRRCLELDPADPYALGNVIEYEISAAGDLTVVEAMREQIVAASRRCRSQALAGENLPWAFFDAGKFALLLGRPYEALASYAKAVRLATTEHMLATTSTSLERLEALGGAITGSTWAQRLLAIARAVRFPSQAALDALGETAPIAGVDDRSRVVMLTGGTDESAERWLEVHAETLREGFEGFEGLIVSGGTRHGVAGLAGSVRERTLGEVTAVGFLPANVPENATVDARYDELRRTPGAGFSIAETLQAWGDLIASGVQPATVKLLGVNGGTIAAAEYRVGLALGCSVGMVLGSGREADKLVQDPDWVAAPNLVRLNLDAGAIRGFLLAED